MKNENVIELEFTNAKRFYRTITGSIFAVAADEKTLENNEEKFLKALEKKIYEVAENFKFDGIKVSFFYLGIGCSDGKIWKLTEEEIEEEINRRKEESTKSLR